ncbi:minor capsid protein [Sutcliffiella sp. NC1]|uniref:minor capsid protein n=1 Tax=Sutcliffiella sp. NC1 TaxID=3004096 RepID=UPI0022DE4B2E|nr:minor capsid protein [Sutcliffiella sp. NC1]WBL16369.1 minor capsid protein [Sutcliffiella sp. NC1]
MSKLNKTFLSLLEELLNESDNDFDTVLKQYKDSRNNVKQLIANLFMNHGDDGVLDYNTVYMTTIIDNFNESVNTELNKISAIELLTTTAILQTTYQKSYYKSAFVLEQAIGVNVNFNHVNDFILNEFINQNWSGRHFSERIWLNQNALRESLSNNLERGIREGHKLDKIAKVFDEEFNSKAYQSQRLVRTETARIISEARDQVYEENGIEQVQWLATLETGTCSDCADLDGQIFDRNDPMRPKVPLHPNCKCDTVPVIEGGTNIRKDNETKEYIPYATYEEWEKANSI